MLGPTHSVILTVGARAIGGATIGMQPETISITLIRGEVVGQVVVVLVVVVPVRDLLGNVTTNVFRVAQSVPPIAIASRTGVVPGGTDAVQDIS